MSGSLHEELRRLRLRFAGSAIPGRTALSEAAQLAAARWSMTASEREALAAMIRAEAEPDREHVKAVLAFASSIVPPQECACGSGEDVAACCYVRASPMRPSKVTIGTSGPRTNVELPRCYARATRDCRKPLSREHYLSECVIKELYPDGTREGLTVSGVGDLRDASLAPKALAAKVLCRRHNEALSPLDAVGGEFVRALKAIAVAAHARALDRLELRRSFYGPDIERWFLKVLIGTLASRGARYGGKKVPRMHPPSGLLEVLLGRAELAPMAGLVLVPSTNLDLAPDSGASIAFTPFAWGGQPAALALRAWSFAFVMAARPPTAGPDANALANGSYRPRQIWIHNAKDARIDLDWEPPWDGPVAMVRAVVSSGLPPS